MRSLFYRLAVLLVLVTALLRPGGPALAAPRPSDSAPLPLNEYWSLVEHTRQIVAGLSAEPSESVRPALDELVSQWEAVKQVQLKDGQTVPVDNSYLVLLLKSSNTDNLTIAESLVETLLEAHRKYPSEVFTAADLDRLNAILSDPRFQWKEAQLNPIQKWIQEQFKRFTDWLNSLFGEQIKRFNEWLNSLFGNNNFSGDTFSLVPILTTILLVAVLAYVFRSLFFDLVAESRLAEDASAEGEPLTAEQALARAHSLSRGGDYRSAVRYLYLSSLLLLDERGLLRYDRSKTNREYLRSLSNTPELSEPLNEVIDVFDNVWYGYHSLDEDTFKHYSDRVEELKEKKTP